LRIWVDLHGVAPGKLDYPASEFPIFHYGQALLQHRSAFILSARENDLAFLTQLVSSKIGGIRGPRGFKAGDVFNGTGNAGHDKKLWPSKQRWPRRHEAFGQLVLIAIMAQRLTALRPL
jgi:hypothetical protein